MIMTKTTITTNQRLSRIFPVVVPTRSILTAYIAGDQMHGAQSCPVTRSSLDLSCVRLTAERRSMKPTFPTDIIIEVALGRPWGAVVPHIWGIGSRK
jgi:hypothetical protein